MKTVTALSYLAAVSALAAFPTRIEITISLVLAAGLALLLAQELTPRRPLRLPARSRARAGKLRARFYPPALNSGAGRLAA
jgi:hypothetical protein